MTKFRALFVLLLLTLSCTATAKIYKSTDAEGNVVYSDIPTSGGEVIQVPKINVADPVAVSKSVPPAPKSKAVVEKKAPTQTIIIYDDGGHNVIPVKHRKREPSTKPSKPLKKLPKVKPRAPRP